MAKLKGGFMKMGTIEPIGGVDKIAFIRGAVEKYQGKGVDDELISYIKKQSAQKELKEVKHSTSNNTEIPKFPTLGEFQRAVRKWHDGLLYMPSMDYMTEYIYSDYIRKLR